MEFVKQIVKTLTVMLVLSILCISGLSGSSSDKSDLEIGDEVAIPLSVFFEPQMSTFVEEFEATEPQKPVFPNDEQVKLISRMAEGIYRWKTMKEKIPFYFCGEGFVDLGAEDKALTIAYHIVKASREASDDDFTMNPWGVAGTVRLESGFDLCAFGLYPRKAAYKTMMKNGKPILKPRRITISHTKKEVITAIQNKKMLNMFETFDLGMLQTLAKYYPGKPEDLITWGGFYWQVLHMKGRGQWNKTGRPWIFWPGPYSPAYDRRVTKYARQLGATKDEI